MCGHVSTWQQNIFLMLFDAFWLCTLLCWSNLAFSLVAMNWGWRNHEEVWIKQNQGGNFSLVWSSFGWKLGDDGWSLIEKVGYLRPKKRHIETCSSCCICLNFKGEKSNVFSPALSIGCHWRPLWATGFHFPWWLTWALHQALPCLTALQFVWFGTFGPPSPLPMTWPGPHWKSRTGRRFVYVSKTTGDDAHGCLQHSDHSCGVEKHWGKGVSESGFWEILHNIRWISMDFIDELSELYRVLPSLQKRSPPCHGHIFEVLRALERTSSITWLVDMLLLLVVASSFASLIILDHPWSSSIILNHPHTLFLQSWHKLSLSEKILMINASGMVSSGFDAFQSLLQHACLRSFVRSYGKLNGTEDSMSLQRMDKQIKKLITLVWSNNALDLMIFLDSIYNADNIIYTTL